MTMNSGVSGTPAGAIGKLWALTVGINRYRSFPPLQYARQDAEGLFHFLQRYRHLAPGRGILLTDVSPDQGASVPWRSGGGTADPPQTTLPSRDNWWSWLQSLCTTDLLQPEDVLWVSFSGYAIHYQNEDYLIPWDGDPQAIVETAISVRSLFNLLHGARTSRILLVLDMSRSQGIFAPEQRPGQQTAQLATQFGIQTLLSCQPYQFAHESADLRLGLFTSALLEGLRIHRLDTLGEIALYLSDRVPQLCDLHWKPLQIPLGIGSPGFVVYPQAQATIPPARGETARSGDSQGITPILIPVIPVPQGSPQPKPAPAGSVPIGSALGSTSAQQNPTVSGLGSGGSESGTPTLPVLPWPPHPGPAVTNGAAEPQRVSETRIPDPSFQPRFQYVSTPQRTRSSPLSPLSNFLRWFTIAFLLLGGVLLWQRLGLMGNHGGIAPTLRQRLLPSGGLQRPEALPPGVTDQRWLYEPLPSDGSPSDGSPSNQSPSDTSPGASPDPLALENQGILREARTLFQDNQASRFSDAIAILRQIQPGEPLYDQAQADIDRWSQIIFDFALGRAQGKDYEAAIEAARLVPWDQAQYPEAQAAIAYWQEKLNLQSQISDRLDEAFAIIQPKSASSYSDGIALLRTIPTDHPDYADAQYWIEEWSFAILTLAEERAAQGNYTQAIEAAELVPDFTTAHETAQGLMETWRE